MDRANYFAKYTKDDLALIKLFKEELSNINLLYLQAINSKDVTKANSLLKKMGAITKTLDAEYGERATKRIPQEYLLGAKYIDDTLTKEASYIAINKANSKELAGMVKELGTVHVEAVNALLNNSKNYIKSSLDGMERQALTMLNELQQEKVRETLARSTITGDSLQTMKDKIVKYFEQNQITVFKDRGGKTRSLDRYADMLTRTETSIANIQGTLNRAIQLGITKFKVVEQADCCEICSEYRNEIVDITDGTVDLPPYHPNCRGYVIAVLNNEEKETISPKLENVVKNQEPDYYNTYPEYPDEDTKEFMDYLQYQNYWGRDPKGLPPISAGALDYYTGDWCYSINQSLRNWDLDNATKYFTDVLSSTINHNLDYTDTVYRWEERNIADIEALKNSWLYENKWYMSTSKNTDLNFRNSAWFEKKIVKYDIEHKWGMNIKKWSRNSYEDEILLDKGKSFNAEYVGEDNNGIVHFILKEI